MRIKGRAGRENGRSWLLIKEKDADATAKVDITRARPESVATGRDLDEIAASRDRIWDSKTGEREDVPKETKSAARRVSRAKPSRFSRNGKDWTEKFDRVARSLRKSLEAIETKSAAVSNAPRASAKTHWVRPKLVAQVGFTEWTPEGSLRHSTFKGLREDKPATAIVREEPEPIEEAEVSKSKPPRAKAAKKPAKGAAGDAEVAGVRLSHPDRVLYPDQGVTKRGLALYYEAISDWILPHLEGRPTALVRCPAGVGGSCFYQKHVGAEIPDSVERVKIQEKTKSGDYVVVDSLPSLVSLVQIGILEIHTWNSCADRLEQPDRVVFDLDPDPYVGPEITVDAARAVKKRLEEIGLESFVKTTGGKGLHVVVPLARPGWDTSLAFARGLVEAIAAVEPDASTTTVSKAKRKGKIFLDYLRNSRGATSVAAYSTRARPGATVSVPLDWKELSEKPLRTPWTVATLSERLAYLPARSLGGLHEGAAVAHGRDPREGGSPVRDALERLHHRDPERPPARRRFRIGRAAKWIGIGLLALLVLAIIATFFWDEPLRRRIEARMNARLKGYSVVLPKAHFSLFGLSVTLNDLTVRQQANPEPPVLVIPRLHAGVHWKELLSLHLVADFLFDRPRLHINRPQLEKEVKDETPVKDRGWQQALEAVYPLKINVLRIRDGDVTYIDEDPAKPLRVSHLQLRAENIRNIHSRDREYPSAVHAEGVILDKGRGVADGHANFLSEPLPGFQAAYHIENVPLDPFRPIVARSNLVIENGAVWSNGDLELAPKIQSVHVWDFTVHGVTIDYIHTAATTKKEQEQVRAVERAAKKAANTPDLVLKLDRLTLTDSEIGMINKAKDPGYRVSLKNTHMEVTNLSNHFENGPARLDLTAKFLGSGPTKATATFRPDAKGPDFDIDVAIGETDMTRMNDLLRAYGKFDVVAGKFSFYSEPHVKNRAIDGYVKPLFKDMDVYDKRQDAEKSFFRKIYESLVALLRGFSRTASGARWPRRPKSTAASTAPRRARGRSSAGSSRTRSPTRSCRVSTRSSRSCGSRRSGPRIFSGGAGVGLLRVRPRDGARPVVRLTPSRRPA